METQDHKKLNQSGRDGLGGVHVCHKCRWPFPNPHPSSRHRRAHKKLCGTIEGYKLDLNSSVGEHFSDDDNKITSDKVIERTISRKSSSGVGSRSSRSTRSEDEVFTDAVAEFDGMGSEVSSDGATSQRNSLQNVAESDSEGFKPAVENAIGDDLSASSVVFEDKEQGIVRTFERNNGEAKCAIPSQDQISSSITEPCLVSASVTRECKTAVEQYSMQSSGAPSVLDTGDKIAHNHLEIRNPFNETAEDVLEQVSGLTGLNEERSDSLSNGGTVKLTEMQSTELGRVEGSRTVDSPENFDHSLNLVQGVDNTDRYAGKSLGVVEHEPKVGGNGNADVQDVSDALLAQGHLEIAPEDSDRRGGNHNSSLAIEAPSVVESTEERLKQEARQTKHKAEEETAGGLDHTSVLKASCGDTRGLQSQEVREEIRDKAWEDLEVSSIDKRKSSVSSEKVFTEVTTTGGNHDEATSVYGGANAIDAVKDDNERLVMHESDSSKGSVGELSVASSTLPECAFDDILTQAKKPMNACDSNAVGNLENFRVDEMTVGVENDNERLHIELATGFGSAVAVSNDDIEEKVESVKAHDHGKVDKVIESNNFMSGHSHLENGLTPEGIIEEQSACEIVVKTDDSFHSTLKTSEDAASFCSSGTAAVGSCAEKFVEHASDTESDKMNKQHINVSAIDIAKPSEQNDSDDSVTQYVAYAFPPNTPVSNSSQASAEPEADNVEPRAMDEVQFLESKTSLQLEPLRLGKTYGTSEIQTFENQKETALKTLLGEAIAKSREDSPNYESFPAKNSNPEASKQEVGKEWDSPARYPVKIKTEKRKPKSKSSYWVPFLCCSSSSVNAHGP